MATAWVAAAVAAAAVAAAAIVVVDHGKVVVDHDQFVGTLIDQGVQEFHGAAGGAEPGDSDGGAVFSIGDGVCDCCDGSDERRGATCPDRCREGALAQLASPFRGSDSRPKKPKLTGAYRQASGTQGRLRARGHRR